MATVIDKATKKEVPEQIAVRTIGLEPEIALWVDDNPDVPFAILARRGLKKELKPYTKKLEVKKAASNRVLKTEAA